MTIDEAISLLTGIEGGNSLKYLPEHRDAIQLGIEALKRIQDIRQNDFTQPLLTPGGHDLPGETEEEK